MLIQITTKFDNLLQMETLYHYVKFDKILSTGDATVIL